MSCHSCFVPVLQSSKWDLCFRWSRGIPLTRPRLPYSRILLYCVFTILLFSFGSKFDLLCYPGPFGPGISVAHAPTATARWLKRNIHYKKVFEGQGFRLIVGIQVGEGWVVFCPNFVHIDSGNYGYHPCAFGRKYYRDCHTGRVPSRYVDSVRYVDSL